MKNNKFKKTLIVTSCLILVGLTGEAHAQLSINPFPLRNKSQSNISAPTNLNGESIVQSKAQEFTDWNDDIVVRAQQVQSDTGSWVQKQSPNLNNESFGNAAGNVFASRPQNIKRQARSWAKQPSWRTTGTVPTTQVSKQIPETVLAKQAQFPIKETVVLESTTPDLPKNAMYSNSPSVELYADPIMTSVQPSMKAFQQQTAAWQAYRGASLYEVITTWADTQGIEVLWDVVESYRVQETTLVDGSFEEALGNLLSQYEQQYTRPVGNLHVNPAGGRTLVIVSHKGA